MAFSSRSDERLDVGSLDKWLLLQSRNPATGAYADVDTVPGSLVFVSGSQEALMAGAPISIGQWLGKIRYRTDVKAEWRFVDVETGRVFQISSYGDPTGRKSLLRLVCTEIQ